MSDKEKCLLSRCKTGDIDAFEQLIENHQKKVFNLALRMIGNHEDASDLAQEVFIKVYKSIRDFKEKASFSTWLYRITTNVCLDEIRKRKNRDLVSLDEDIKFDDNEIRRQVGSDEPGPEVLVERAEIRNVIRNAINRMPVEYKTVIVLRDIQGLSYEEIAAILSCPKGTVKSRINRARQTLRGILISEKELLNSEYVK